MMARISSTNWRTLLRLLRTRADVVDLPGRRGTREPEPQGVDHIFDENVIADLAAQREPDRLDRSACEMTYGTSFAGFSPGP